MGAGGGGSFGSMGAPISMQPAVDPSIAAAAQAADEEKKKKAKADADLAAAGAARTARDNDQTTKSGASRAIGYVGAPNASSKRMLLGV